MDPIVGLTNARGSQQAFRIRANDRLSHMYAIGETGVGKTTFIENLIKQDITSGKGCALFDPHGDLARRLRGIEGPTGELPLYVDIAVEGLELGYNPLTKVSPAFRPLVASGLISVMKKMWPDAWGVRMEHILRNALLALLDQPSATLPDVLLLLRDKRFRRDVVRQIQNEQVKEFWIKEFPGYSTRFAADSLAPIQNKVGAFLADPRLKCFVCPPGKALRLRQIMDEGRALIVNLSKGTVGEDSASTLGAMLVTAIGLAALSRANQPEAARRPFFLYLDEFQNVTTLAIAEMLAELRKYGVGLVMAHQYLKQLDPDVRSAVLGNAGTICAFRVGAEDAPVFAQQFAPAIDLLDLMNQPNRSFYIRLMIDGTPSRPFSAVTVEQLAAQIARRERW